MSTVVLEAGAQAHPKSSDLSKTQVLKIWAKMAPNIVLFLKTVPNVCRKTH